LPRVREIPRESAVDTFSWVPTDSLGALLLTLAIGILVLIFLPYIFFVLELLVVPAVFAYRIALGRSWTIEASSGRERRRWQVQGWRRSGDAAEEIASALRRGDDVRALEVADRA
jgi:hypothetical protein